jgi:hypothetical protein
MKRAPEGFDEIEPTLEEFAKKMKEGKIKRFDLEQLNNRDIIMDYSISF